MAVLGGADIIRQCIRGGLLDELRLHVVHIVLGGGTALFGGLGPAEVALERVIRDQRGVLRIVSLFPRLDQQGNIELFGRKHRLEQRFSLVHLGVFDFLGLRGLALSLTLGF